MRGATSENLYIKSRFNISIHAPRMGRDSGGDQGAAGRTYISIHAPRMGRDLEIYIYTLSVDCISIHAPRMGRDYMPSACGGKCGDFNPRAPYGARPRSIWRSCPHPCNFNPRAPYGARLSGLHCMRRVCRYFNPRAPYGARPAPVAVPVVDYPISIHAPRMGRDVATMDEAERLTISIHAPRMGRDARCPAFSAFPHHFNPRAPYGARQQLPKLKALLEQISIHAPRMGRDRREDRSPRSES